MTENGKSKRAPAVVVGIDGSAGATAALRWALDEGRLRNRHVRAVHAWTDGATMGIDEKDLRRAAEDLLEQALAEVTSDTAGIEIEREVVKGLPAGALVGAVTSDDLLVVGSRGHGGFTGLLLGSVSQQCVHHAPCPVVVVHAPRPTTNDDEYAHAGPAEREVAA